MVRQTCHDLQGEESGINRGSRSALTEDARGSARSNNCDTCNLLYDLVEYFGVGRKNEITVGAPTHPRDTLKVSTWADLDEGDVILNVFVDEGFESGHPLIRSSPNVRRSVFTRATTKNLSKQRVGQKNAKRCTTVAIL